MSKERLEEIKRQFNIIKSNLIRLDRDTNATDDYEWLIEQAERVQELEEKLIEAKDDYDYLSYHYGNETEQNKRYREAIKRAIGKFNYDEHQQGMSILLKALEKSE